jgi:rhodanese-related sulfurtransferase
MTQLIKAPDPEAILANARKLGISSEETARTVQDIKAINDSLSQITHSQYALVKDVYKDAEQIRVIYNDSNVKADKALNNLIASVSAIESVFSRIDQSIRLFDNIKQSTDSIHRVVLQTKILALNAAAEAARVGESGRGFKIVASELQELVNVCSQAAKEIDRVVDSTHAQVRAVVLDAKSHVADGRHSTTGVSEALQNLLIVFSGDTQEKGSPSVQAIVQAVANMEQLADKTMTMADNSKAATEKLNAEVELSNQALSDLIGTVTNKPIINLNPLEAFGRISEFRVIDVRRPDEFNDQLGHIANAKSFPIHEKIFSSRLNRLEKSHTYLFVCRSGGRSARAARIAQSLGFSSIFNLKGGMLAWNERRLPTVR